MPVDAGTSGTAGWPAGESALDTLRTKTKIIGSNTALLQTRLEYTESYANTLQTDADKLTLADLKEAAANLLALRVREQVGTEDLA